MNNNVIEGKVVLLPIDDIIPNRFQPREVFDESGLEELAESIREHGVIQPVIVRPFGDKYELIAGERRTKAAALAGLTKIPAIIREMDDNESAKVSLLENLQRRNLSAIEEARTYKKILELENMTQEQLAKTMGRSQPMIANKLRLLALPEEIQDALVKNQISERHARSLLNVKDREQQLKFLDRIRDERLTVRELDSEIKKMQANTSLEENSAKVEEIEERIVDTNMNNGNMMNGNFGGNGNNFNAPNNYRNNYGNMGLNDYQSSINNGMFNNIPNFSNQANPYNQQPSNAFDNQYSSSALANEAIGMNGNNGMGQGNMFANSMPEANNQNISFNNNPFGAPNNVQPNNNPGSLGSMLDNSPISNNQGMNGPIPSNDEDDSNRFVSQIKEDVSSPKENKFLPNFVNEGPGSFNNQNDFSSNSNNFNDNFGNNGSEFTGNDFSGQNFNDDFSNNFSNSNNNFPIPNSNGPINDFSFPNNNSNNNFSTGNMSGRQGGLFNEPLNIVDVSNNNANFDMQSNDNYDMQDTNTNKPNYFDFSKPISNDMNNNFNDNTNDTNNINSNNNASLEENYSREDNYNSSDNYNSKEDNWTSFTDTVPNIDTSSKPKEMDDVEIIDSVNDNSNNASKKDYIRLDPVMTIFDTKGAVLELKKTTDRIKQNNIRIDTEEIEFDDYYQIVIKIKK